MSKFVSKVVVSSVLLYVLLASTSSCVGNLAYIFLSCVSHVRKKLNIFIYIQVSFLDLIKSSPLCAI